MSESVSILGSCHHAPSGVAALAGQVSAVSPRTPWTSFHQLTLWLAPGRFLTSLYACEGMETKLDLHTPSEAVQTMYIAF